MKYQNTFTEALTVKVSQGHIGILDEYCKKNDCNRSQALRKMIEQIEDRTVIDINNADHIAALAEAVARYNAGQK